MHTQRGPETQGRCPVRRPVTTLAFWGGGGQELKRGLLVSTAMHFCPI